MIQNIKRTFLFSIVFFGLALSSCTKEFDIKKAQELGETSKDLEQDYKTIVDNIYESCLRTARYRGPIRQKTKTTATREDLENSCISYAYYQNVLLISNEALAQYTSAFRELSFDKFIEDLSRATNLMESIQSLPVSGLERINQVSPVLRVVGPLANSIRRSVAQRRSIKRLRQSITDDNTNIQIYIATLATVTDDIYGNQLNMEQSAMKAYYSPVVSQELDKTEEKRLRNPITVHPEGCFTD